ncbi:MAG: chromosome segregation ATPase [Francisellaceae bacterium]
MTVKLTFTVGDHMTDITLLTIAFTFFTVAAILAAIIFTRHKNRITNAIELDKFSNVNNELTTQLFQQKDENSVLKSNIAAKDSTLVYFQAFEQKAEELQLHFAKSGEELSTLKSVNCGLNAQVDEKSLIISQLKTDIDIEKQQKNLNQENVSSLSSRNAELTEKLNQMGELRNELTAIKQLLISKDELLSELKTQLATDQEAQKSLQEKIELLERSEQRLTTQFENTANKIFKEKTGEFSDQNKTSLDALLTPLKEQIGSFSKQVTDVYTAEAKERHALKQEVTSLKALNEHMSKEANALTKALKGDNKKQGTWGEVVLERVLQDA